jgi:hypothetical protein
LKKLQLLLGALQAGFEFPGFRHVLIIALARKDPNEAFSG